MTRIFRTALVAMMVVGLASCSLFGPDQRKIDEADAQVATFNLAQAGRVIAEYSSGSGTSYAIYTYEIVLRGPEVIERVDELLRDADFELQPSTAFGITYLLRDEGKEFTATVTTFEEATGGGTETGKEENSYNAEIGDVRMSIISSL